MREVSDVEVNFISGGGIPAYLPSSPNPPQLGLKFEDGKAIAMMFCEPLVIKFLKRLFS